EIPQRGALRNDRRYRLAPVAQDRKLGPRRVIFRQQRDLLEKFRTGGVIEILRRQPLRVPRQIADHVAGKRGSLLVETLRFVQSGGVHIHDGLLDALSGALEFERRSGGIVGEAQSRELPAMMRIKEVAIGNTAMPARGCKRGAAQ